MKLRDARKIMILGPTPTEVDACHRTESAFGRHVRRGDLARPDEPECENSVCD